MADGRQGTGEGHRVSTDELNRRRRLAVELRRGGCSVREAARRSGLSPPTVIAAYRAYESGGEAAVDVQRKGSSVGVGAKLTAAEEDEIQRVFRSDPPAVLRRSLWSAELAHTWISRELGLPLARRSLTRYLRRWGFAPSDEELEEHVDNHESLYWCTTQFPEAQLEARRIGAILRWCEAKVLAPLVTTGAGVGAAGRTTMLQTVLQVTTLRGDAQWRVCDGRVSATAVIDFFESAFNDLQRRLYLLVDARSAFNAENVQAWARRNDDRIWLVQGAPRCAVRHHRTIVDPRQERR